jgi:hypothetical protein
MMPSTVPSLSVTVRPLMRYRNIKWAAYSIAASGLTVTTNEVIRSAAFMAALLVCWKIIQHLLVVRWSIPRHA